MANPYLEIKKQFYELIGALSIEEVLTNRPLIEVIERLSRMLVTVTQ